MPPISLTVSALAATAILATAGCGSSTTTASLSRAQLIAKANAICARLKANTDKINIQTTQDLGRLAPRIVLFDQGALLALSRLKPPPSFATDWKTILTSEHQLAEDMTQLGIYARANNLAGARTVFVESQQTHTALVTTANEDGITECTKLT